MCRPPPRHAGEVVHGCSADLLHALEPFLKGQAPKGKFEGRRANAIPPRRP
jgi:hypothetical protein